MTRKRKDVDVIEKIVCVHHRDGWCATTRKTERYSDHVKTLCNHVVTYPWGLEYQDPDWVDCPECRKRLGTNRNAGRGEK